MASKFLEIGPGQNLLPTRFEILEVQKNIYRLKTKNSHVGLNETLKKWLKSNNTMGESVFTDMLLERGNSMIKQAYRADNLFIGSYQKWMHWSVSQEKVTNNYGGIMDGEIWSMAETNDNKYLFLSDNGGCLKQVEVKKQKIVKDFGKIHGCIGSIAITSDDKFLFTSGEENNGHIKKFLVIGGQMMKDQGVIFKNGGVWAINVTFDNKYLFAGSEVGNLKQISLEIGTVIHDYGEIHGDSIRCLETSRDSQWLFTGSDDKHVKRISVWNREVVKDFGKVCDYWITRMKIKGDGERLLVGDDCGYLKLLSSRDGKVVKDFKQAHDSVITGIMITADRKFFFTSSLDGLLKQWNNEDNTLVRDYGKMTDSINSLCL